MKYWIFLAATLLLASGCSLEEKSERAANQIIKIQEYVINNYGQHFSFSWQEKKGEIKNYTMFVVVDSESESMKASKFHVIAQEAANHVFSNPPNNINVVLVFADSNGT